MKQLNHDDLVRARGTILTLTSLLEEVLTDGLPAPPKKAGLSLQEYRDELSSHDEWHEYRRAEIKSAKNLLRELFNEGL